MKLVFYSFCCCWSFLLVPGRCQTTAIDVSLLIRTLDALTRGLHYMDKTIKEINYDAVFCVRRVEEQLQAFLQFQPNVFKSIHYWVDGLRKRAGRIADNGRDLLYKNEPDYTNPLGFLLSPGKKLIWYPSISTSQEATVVPVPCKNSKFNGTFSDWCFSQLSDGGNSSSVCLVSPSCMQHHQKKGFRGYVITHQVLFWELMETRNCINRMSQQLRTNLCSNVLRDAKQAEKLNFPLDFEDLFMEQIGLCGIWGFRDFHRKEWLEKILHWQTPSGCYFGRATHFPCQDDLTTVIHSRVKRTEKLISDGCYSHKTGVALLALVSSVRFQAEKIFAGQVEKNLANSVL